MTSTLLAVMLTGLAVTVWPAKRQRARTRLVRLRPWPVPTTTPAERMPRPAHRARLLAVVVAGIATATFFGMPWGVPAGAAVAVGGYLVLARFGTTEGRKRGQRVAADLPVAVDLLAACLASGSTPVAAAHVVSQAVGGPIGESLGRVVSLLRLGGDPIDSWGVLDDDPLLAPLGRAVARAMTSGAPVAAALEHVAATAREDRRVAVEEAARKVGVKAAAPLGLCFLPAFVLLGVVPVAAGIATTIHL